MPYITTPAVLTACKLMGAFHDSQRNSTVRALAPTLSVARLATDIHKLAKPCHKLAVAECNGEWKPGQRDRAFKATCAVHATDSAPQRDAYCAWHVTMGKSITDYATRMDKKIAALNAQLEPFGFVLNRNGGGDGLRLVMAELPLNASATHYEIV